MSKPRYRWWGYVRNVIRAYPALKEKYDDLHQQAVTANYSAQPRTGGDGRSLENIALRELIPQEQREYQAVRDAIAATLRYDTGLERVQFISAIYFSGPQRRLSDVYPRFHIAEATAWRWHGDFIRLVAGYMGLTN